VETLMTDQISRNEKSSGAILRRARKNAELAQGSLSNQIHRRPGTINLLPRGWGARNSTHLALMTRLAARRGSTTEAVGIAAASFLSATSSTRCALERGSREPAQLWRMRPNMGIYGHLLGAA